MARTLPAALALVAAAAAAGAQTEPPRRSVVIGCITPASASATSSRSGGGQSTFVITDTRRTPPAVFRLDGDPKQLAWLVGQTVEVAGPVTPAAAKQPPTLKVASLTRISTTCEKRQ